MTLQTQTQTAIVVLSDPNGSEEALGRVFNALAAAHELKARGGQVAILFQGTGTRWPEQLSKPEHPAHALFQGLFDQIVGASCGCAEIFGATAGVEAAGVPLLSQVQLPGTSGVASLVDLVDAGYSLLTF